MVALIEAGGPRLYPSNEILLYHVAQNRRGAGQQALAAQFTAAETLLQRAVGAGQPRALQLQRAQQFAAVASGNIRQRQLEARLVGPIVSTEPAPGVCVDPLQRGNDEAGSLFGVVVQGVVAAPEVAKFPVAERGVKDQRG